MALTAKKELEPTTTSTTASARPLDPDGPPTPDGRDWLSDMRADLRAKHQLQHQQQQAALRTQQQADVKAKVELSPLNKQGLQPTAPKRPAPPAPEQPTAKSAPSSSGRKLALADFELGRVVGAGSFGRVFIAKLKSTGEMYAVKCLSKSACITGGQVKHVTDERRMLTHLKHPFIVRLEGTFQDADSIYMAMEFVPGGEFFTMLRTHGRMREEHARFYAAQVVLSLEYMHSRNVVYRDLKPENLLVGADGYLRMADMGFAKVVATKTNTMCGTPDYMAPEIILNKGHTKAVDWWSLGCVIYEMLWGFPPYYTGKAKETYAKILNPLCLVFPDTFSSLAKDLLHNLLQHDPEARLKFVHDIKSHPWFGGMDWTYVLQKMYKPPRLPTVNAAGDYASNFDNYSQLAPMRHGVVTPEQDAMFASF